MKSKMMLVVGIALGTVTFAAHAQNTGPARASDYTPSVSGIIPSAPADGCELHVWPAERMKSETTSLLSSFGLVGGLVDEIVQSGKDTSNKALIASALDSPSQLDALQQLDLRTSLPMTPGTTIIPHDQPLDRKSMNKVKTRRAVSASKCYSELIVADVLYEKRPLLGSSLKTLFLFRTFGDDQRIDREYKSWGGNGLKLFPPNEGEDAIAAVNELVSVFRANFEEFAKNARTRLAAKK